MNLLIDFGSFQYVLRLSMTKRPIKFFRIPFDCWALGIGIEVGRDKNCSCW